MQAGDRQTNDNSGHPEAASALSGGAKEILIVDNDERIVELVSWFLSKRGFSVRTAANFTTARQLLSEKPVDLLLSDIDLGVESALDALPALEKEGVLPPTLVFSGYLDSAAKERLMALGPVVGTLAKPVEFQVLESCVLDYFNGRSVESIAGDTSGYLPRSGVVPGSSGGGVGGAFSAPTAQPASKAQPADVQPVQTSSDDDWVEILPPNS